MGQCMKCKEFLPPDFLDRIQPGNTPICHFCQKGSGLVFGEGSIMYNKNEVVTDYKRFMAELKDSQNITQKITNLTVESAVKDIKH